MVVLINMLLYKVVLIVFLVVPLKSQYHEDNRFVVPVPEIQAFVPKGFRASIEDVPGIRMFVFNGNINRELRSLEPGGFSGETRHIKNGKWSVEDHNLRLEVDDVIYYWIFVIKDRLGYRLENGRFVIKELIRDPHHDPQQPDKWRPQEESATSTNPVQQPAIPTTASPEIDIVSLGICEETVLNATQTLLSLQYEVNALRKTNQQLINVLQKYPDSKTLTLSGRIPPDGEASVTAKFIIQEKLELNPDIVSAVRNNDGSITIEVSTLSEKLEILEEAKEKLKNTKIDIS